MNQSHTSNQHLIFAEKISALRHHAKVNIASNLTVSTVVAVFLARGTFSDSQWIWLFVVWVNASSQIISYVNRRRGTIADRKFLRGCMFSSLVSGVLWASFVPLFVEFQPGNTDVFIVNVILCGIVGASFTTTSLFIPMFFVFTVPFMLTYLGMLLFSYDFDYAVLALLTFIFYLMCSNLAIMLSRQMSKSFALRFENMDMFEELKLQKELAEKANTSKSKFLASASHDLRQPLHALGYFIDALKVSNQEEPALFSKIDASISNLEALFNSLLDISKLDADAVDVCNTHFSLYKLFCRIKDVHAMEATTKSIAFDIGETEEVVFSDIALVESVLSNLVSNAIRYTDIGKVSITVTEDGPDQLVIAIKDTGIGIGTEEIDKIFDEYYQLNNPERDRRKGMGLGLSIVERLCALLGSKLSVESTLEVGSTFSITLPRGKSELVRQPKASSTLQKGNLIGKQILVIDDEIDIRESMERSLSTWGCEVVCCESGAEALKLIDEQDVGFDLLISDMRLRNGESGIEVMDSILTKAGKKDIPALLITGDAAANRISESRQSGYVLLHKPLRPAVLRLHLIDLLGAN